MLRTGSRPVSPDVRRSFMNGNGAIAYVPFHDARKWAREGLRTRDAHVARELARDGGRESLLIVNRPTCIAELAKLRGRWRTPGKVVFAWPTRAIAVGPADLLAADQLTFALGFRRSSFHRWLLDAYGTPAFVDHVRASLEHVGGTSETTLWLCHPFAASLTKVWRGRIVVDAFDNFAIHPHIPAHVRGDVHDAYKLLADRADRIAVNAVATQEYLARHFQRESLFVPNAVDPTLFVDVPPLPLEFERPIIGYAGKLALRIDVNLLLRLANSLTRGTIVLAGPIMSRGWIKPLLAHPRIRHIGDLPYSRLPSFLSALDVAIVPHRVGDGENGGDPTKLYEYLAAGRVIVTTAIGGTERFVGRAYVARTGAEFVDAVQEAAAGDPMPSGKLGPDETWQARTRQLLEYFDLSR